MQHTCTIHGNTSTIQIGLHIQNKKILLLLLLLLCLTFVRGLAVLAGAWLGTSLTEISIEVTATEAYGKLQRVIFQRLFVIVTDDVLYKSTFTYFYHTRRGPCADLT